MRPSLAKRLPVEIQYRVYYSEETKICTQKSITEIETADPFVFVDRDTYNNISFCSLYRISHNNKVELIPVDSSNIQLELYDNGYFITIKNNMLFPVNEHHTEPVDRWRFK